MHYISPLGLNWYASCSLQTDVVQQRLKWEFIQDHPGIICNGGVSGALINFKVRQNVQVCGNTGASDSTSISSYFTSEYQAAYWQLCSNPKAICARVRERKKKKKDPIQPWLSNTWVLCQLHELLWGEAANTIFPLITHARSSGAINWFWEPSSIFNPSSGSAGQVKTSLKTRTRVEFGTFKV